MHTVVIADDESLERIGLRKLIGTYFHDLEIVGEVVDGQEAIDICAKKKPDIIIIDIKMPFVNGIEAAKRISEISKDTHVIISSAFSDFEYMNKAITLGIDDYLLKPYSIEQLSSAINHTIGKLEHSRKTKESTQVLNNKLIGAIPIVESQFTTLAIRGNIYKDEIKKYFEIMDKDFSSGIIILFGVKEKLDEVRTDLENLEVKIKQIFRFLYVRMHEEFKCALSIVSPNKIVLIISLKEIKKTYSVKTYAEMIADQLCTKVYSLFKEKLDVGISNVYKGENDIAFAYQEAYTALLATTNPKEKKTIKDLVVEAEDVERYPLQKEENLILAIKLGNETLCYQCIDEIFIWFANLNAKSDSLVSTKVYLNSLISSIQKLIIDKVKNTAEFSIFTIAVSEELREISDIPKIGTHFKESLVEVMEVFKDSHEDKSKRIISRAEKYILDHYYTEISLDDLAESALLSPPYFCKLFKEVTGESFVKYLTKIRMQESNKLLEESELKVTDIGYKVGFNNPDYFLRVYKKYYGITPSEYRKSVQ